MRRLTARRERIARAGSGVGFAVALCLSIAGCATPPQARFTGALKPGGFVFAPSAPGEGDLQALVAERLSADGLHPSPAASADYIVYIGASAPPASVGVYLPDAKAPQAPPADWTVDPAHGKKRRLQILVLNRLTGAAVFDGAATLTGPGRKAKSALPRLVDAALGVTPTVKP
jgi:hypothetical protein